MNALQELWCRDGGWGGGEQHHLVVPSLVIVGGNEPQKTIELAHEWSQQF